MSKNISKMPPPKAIKLKSHKSIPKIQPIPSSSSAPTQDSQEQQLNFEEELNWCLFKLQKNLETASTPKQIEDTKRSLKILKSTNQPTIKKRQLMRQLFGDYRTKMAQETPTQLDGGGFAISSSHPHKSSYFVKKAAIVDENDKNFKFNFDVNKLEGLNLDAPTDEVKPDHGKIDLPRSNREFRFNFNIE